MRALYARCLSCLFFLLMLERCCTPFWSAVLARPIQFACSARLAYMPLVLPSGGASGLASFVCPY
jgi:hypothetical protein